MENTIIKAGNAEFTFDDVKRIYEKGGFVCTNTAVYQPHFSTAQNTFYFHKVLTVKGIASRGRFYVLQADRINDLLEQNLLTSYC